jgi:transposase-like protein
MRSMPVAMFAFALSLPLPSAAQSGAGQDTTQPAPKKHGGLFGKVKGLAQNKVVQQVAKTAACNMVPGGQLVAGAIDNASAKKAAKNAVTNAAKDAVAGAALGAATGKSTCGMGMMGNLGMAKGVAGAGIPGMPTTGLPGVGTSADQMKQMAEQYRKMGINPAQIQAMQQQMQAAAAGTPAAAMPAGGISPEQIKQMEEQYRKMGMDPAQIKAMLQMMTAASAGASESK